MPALMHLPTKVPSGICSASQTMISCVEVIQINTGMELKFRDWNRWRQALFRRVADCPRASGPHQSAPQWRSLVPPSPIIAGDNLGLAWEVARRASYTGKVYGIANLSGALALAGSLVPASRP